jgi:hypothetical protein
VKRGDETLPANVEIERFVLASILMDDAVFCGAALAREASPHSPLHVVYS